MVRTGNLDRSPTAATVPAEMPARRLKWVDTIKGLAILWIMYFHFFRAYWNERSVAPWLAHHYFAQFLQFCAPVSASGTAGCLGRAMFVAVTMLGFHAVGVFIVMSGFGLTYAIAKTGNPEHGWGRWYRSRVLRLFPVYWLAHLIYLVSPFEARLYPIDYRFLLSFLGDRIYPTDIIEYLNPAWWYFGLIVELYLIFPLLFRMLQKAGAAWFLAICAAVTMVSRALLLFNVIAADGMLITAFCGCRLWEFGFGMVVGSWYRQDRGWVDEYLFSSGGLTIGAILYTAGFYSYYSSFTYIFTDALLGTGLFIIMAQIAWQSRRMARAEAILGYLGAYSYGLYLIHQPYVIYFGTRMRAMGIAEFTILAAAIIAVIAVISAYLERQVNALTNRVIS